jgi:hypothetical protein
MDETPDQHPGRPAVEHEHDAAADPAPDGPADAPAERVASRAEGLLFRHIDPAAAAWGGAPWRTER